MESLAALREAQLYLMLSEGVFMSELLSTIYVCTGFCLYDENVNMLFNPKRCGPFWSPRYAGGGGGGGGVDSTHFGKHTVTPPNFIFEQQTVSHMKAEVFC